MLPTLPDGYYLFGEFVWINVITTIIVLIKMRNVSNVIQITRCFHCSAIASPVSTDVFVYYVIWS